MIKKLITLSVMAVVCINTLKAQWVCDTRYSVYGREKDKFAFTFSPNPKSEFSLSEYVDLPTGGMIVLYFTANHYYTRDTKTNRVAMIEIWLQVGTTWKKYIYSRPVDEGPNNYKGRDMYAIYSKDFSTAWNDTYIIMLNDDKNKAFWSDFKQASSAKIRLKDIDTEQEMREYNFDMTGSSKAYNHVLGVKTPSWDK